MKINEKARVYRELGKLLGSGFHMDRTVDLLLGQSPSAGRRALLLAIRRGLDQGQSFAGALQLSGSSGVSALEVSLLESGERSGQLAEACKHLAHYFEVWDKGVRAARSAMVYPLILLHLGVLVPEFAKGMLARALEDSGNDNMVEAIVWRLLLFWLLLGLIWLAWKTLAGIATRSRAMDEALGMLPLIGSVRAHWALARFCQVFHSGLLAAMRMTECLSMAGEASQSGRLREGAARAMNDVEGGDEISPSLARTGCFPKPFLDSVAAAEAAGGLDSEMARWAQAETESAAEAQQRAADWYPKALYFAVLGYVGYSIIGFARYYLDRLTSVVS